MTPGAREGGLLLAVLVVQAASPHSGGTRPGATASAVAAAAALGQVVVLSRRRRNAVAAAAGVLGLYAVQVAAVDVVAPVALWVALWATAVAVGDRSTALRATAAMTAGALAVIAVAELLRPTLGLGVLVGGLTVAVGLTALLRRTERSRLDAVRAEAAAEERLRIARDLHDLAGHGLGVVAVQSSTARMALDAGDPDTARTALAAVEASSRSALKEMRQLLSVLRDDEPERAAAPGLADVDALVAGVRAAGLDVEASVQAVDVAAGIGLCAYRVVQEALTNAVKHSPDRPVHVDVASRDGRLHVCVTSRGRADNGGAGGSGLDGIRTRVEAVGGMTRIGPTPDGWSVEAELPLEVA